MAHITQCINYTIHESTQIKNAETKQGIFKKHANKYVYTEHIKIVVCRAKRGVGMEHAEEEIFFKGVTDTFQGGYSGFGPA